MSQASVCQGPAGRVNQDHPECVAVTHQQYESALVSGSPSTAAIKISVFDPLCEVRAQGCAPGD